MKIYIWTNTPNWRTPSFFRGVGQPPTSHILSYYPFYVIHLGIVTAPTSHAEKHCCAAAVAVKLGLLGIGAGEARRDFRGSHKRPRWRRMNSWRNGSRSRFHFARHGVTKLRNTRGFTYVQMLPQSARRQSSGHGGLGSISNLILENQEMRDHIVAAALLTELIHTVDGRNPAPPWMVENL